MNCTQHFRFNHVSSDFGIPTLQQRIAESQFDWLCSNLQNAKTKQGIDGTKSFVSYSVTAPYVSEAIKYPNYTICAMGLVYNLLETVPNASQIIYQDAISVAQQIVQEQMHACDLKLALTHMPFASDCEVSAQVPELHLIVCLCDMR